MSRDSSNSPNLKLVMLFNTRNQTYCVCSHNLTAEEASQELDKLRREGLPAFTVEQRSRHKAEEAEGCGGLSCGCRARHRSNLWPFRAGTRQPETTTLIPNLPSVTHKNLISQKLEVPHGK